MPDGILKVAVSIGTPLALAGFTVGVLYLVYRLILIGKLSKVLPEDTFKLLNRIAGYMFILALTAMVLGVSAFILVKRQETRSEGDAELAQEARQHFVQGYYSMALKEADQLIQSNPRNAMAYKIKGNANFKLHEYASALQAFQSALDLDPHLSTALFGEGATLIASGDYGQAKAIFERLHDADPSDMDVRYNLGLANLLMGDYLAAKECYEIIYNSKPDLRANAAIGLGMSEVLGGTTPGILGFGADATSQGVNHFREAVRLEPRLRGIFLGTLDEDLQENYKPYLQLLPKIREVNAYRHFLRQLNSGNGG